MEMFLGFELARNYRVKQLNVVTDLDALKDELSKCNLKGTTTFAISVWSDIAAAIAQLNAASFEPSHSYIDSIDDDGPNVVVAFRNEVATDLDDDGSTQRFMDSSLSYSASSSLEVAQLAFAPADDPPADYTAGPTEGTAPGEFPPESVTVTPTEETSVMMSEAPSAGPIEEQSEPPTIAPTEGASAETVSEAPSSGSNEAPTESTIESTTTPTEQGLPASPTEAPGEITLEPTFAPSEAPTPEPTTGDDEEIIPGDDEYISDEPQQTSSPTESHHHHRTSTALPTYMHRSTVSPTSQRYGHPTHGPTKKVCKCKNQTGCLSKHSAPCCDGLVCKDFRWFSQCVEDEAHHRHQVIHYLLNCIIVNDNQSTVRPDG